MHQIVKIEVDTHDVILLIIIPWRDERINF